MHEHIDYFLNIDDDVLLYYYDPYYTSLNTLKRLRNWFSPNKNLMPISLPQNRAQFVMEFQQLDALGDCLKDFQYKRILNEVQMLRQGNKSWIIAPNIKPFLRKTGVLKYIKSQNNPLYGLYKGDITRKSKSEDTGKPRVLWDKLLNEKNYDDYL